MFLLFTRVLRHKHTHIQTHRYYRRVLSPRLLHSWHHEMRCASANGDVGNLVCIHLRNSGENINSRTLHSNTCTQTIQVRLLECLDTRYENRVETFPNRVNLKCPLTGETYLHLAVRAGSFDAVRTLLLHGSWVDEVDRSGCT